MRRGWLRILEAFIAIILIAGFLTVIYSLNVDKNRDSEEIYDFQKTILNEIANNPNLRNSVLEEDYLPILDFVKNKIPDGFEYKIKICRIDRLCNLDEYRENTYSSERVISANLDEYSPKKLKIFMWSE